MEHIKELAEMATEQMVDAVAMFDTYLPPVDETFANIAINNVLLNTLQEVASNKEEAKQIFDALKEKFTQEIPAHQNFHVALRKRILNGDADIW